MSKLFYLYNAVKNITIKDIAEKFESSISTISTSLNDLDMQIIEYFFMVFCEKVNHRLPFEEMLIASFNFFASS